MKIIEIFQKKHKNRVNSVPQWGGTGKTAHTITEKREKRKYIFHADKKEKIGWTHALFGIS